MRPFGLIDGAGRSDYEARSFEAGRVPGLDEPRPPGGLTGLPALSLRFISGFGITDHDDPNLRRSGQTAHASTKRE